LGAAFEGHTSSFGFGDWAGLGPQVADVSFALAEDGLEELAVGPDLDEVVGDVAAVVAADGEDLPVDAEDPVGGDPGG
jgi:hypothetical protein